ncbi:UNVERIFIED_CONTAM: hypothetical protein Sradi_0424600 [Sesamum radiatum]|uniref:RIN4 pathogenic type III effector avirulence factor Avr cleavage site domain-containing protein n=1 Tax=Sesamum radiatum TaxID=300843 RepID=A0AAW2W6E5_SESRA
MSVPEFGGWDGKSETNYSVVFSQARANKKKHKSEVPARSHNSLGNEFELLPQDHLGDVDPFPATSSDQLRGVINVTREGEMNDVEEENGEKEVTMGGETRDERRGKR